jgi:endonuclease YncB( thermonuclease family)
MTKAYAHFPSVCYSDPDTDKYGRTVGRVYVGDVDANAELVRQGTAWVYRQYVAPNREAESNNLLNPENLNSPAPPA